MKSILLVKQFLGLVEMTSGLVNASFRLPEWQAIKMIFFAPCFVYVQLVGTIQSFLMVDDQINQVAIRRKHGQVVREFRGPESRDQILGCAKMFVMWDKLVCY